MRAQLRNTCTKVTVVSFVLLGLAVEARAAERRAPLIDAARLGDLATVRVLVKQRVDVNVAEADGTTALHWAANSDDAAMVDVLLGAGARWATQNRFGATAFSLACEKGNAAVIQRLLAAGENPNLTVAGEHVLMMAARSGNLVAVKSLLGAGATVNYQEPSRKQTALMWAASAGNTDVIKALIEAGATVGTRSKPPVRPRRINTSGSGEIVRRNDPVGLRAQVDPSYNVNEEGMEFTALLFAARGGHLNAVKTLLDAGADVNDAKTDEGTTALILAIQNRHWELAGLLLDRGADPNRGPGYTALHQLAWSRRLNATFGPSKPEPTGTLSSLALAVKMLARGVDIDAQMKRSFRDGYRNRMNRVGATAFLLSSKLVDMPMMRLLVANGADIYIQNNDWDTPLMLAAGVAVHNVHEDPGTEEEVLAAVNFLVDLGFDVNTVNLNNETAMHGAAYWGYPEVASLLYEKGAKLTVKNILGWAPITIADGVYYAGFFKPQPRTAVRIRELFQKAGLPIPPLPKVNDTDFLTTLAKDRTATTSEKK